MEGSFPTPLGIDCLPNPLEVLLVEPFPFCSCSFFASACSLAFAVAEPGGTEDPRELPFLPFRGGADVSSSAPQLLQVSQRDQWLWLPEESTVPDKTTEPPDSKLEKSVAVQGKESALKPASKPKPFELSMPSKPQKPPSQPEAELQKKMMRTRIYRLPYRNH